MNDPKYLNVKNERGSALIISLMTTVVVVMLGTLIALRSTNASTVAQINQYSNQAFWMAEAGLQRTGWEVATNSCHTMTNQGTTNACTDCGTCGNGNRIVAGSIGAGGYNVTVQNDLSYAISKGCFPSIGAPRVCREVWANLSASSYNFSYGGFSIGKITFSNGGTVDGYDSSVGDYGVPATNKNLAANLGTNSTALGALTFSNGGHIYGSVSTGLNGTVVWSNGGSADGGTTNANNVTMPSVTVPSALTGLTSQGSMYLANGGSNTLAAGSYKYNNINYANGGTLTITGDVQLYLTDANALTASNGINLVINNNASLKIYSDGVINFSNGAVLNNQTKKPSKFMILSMYDSSAHSNAAGIVWANGGTTYGSIYSPKSNITWSNGGTICGAVVGAQLTVANGITIHYDKSLGQLGGSTGKPYNWQEYRWTR